MLHLSISKSILDPDINMRIRLKQKNAKHFRKWMRKGNCPGCGVGCGSIHISGCWARKELLQQLQMINNNEVADLSICPMTVTGNHIWDDEVYRWKDNKNELIAQEIYKKCRACGFYDNSKRVNK